MDSRYLNEFHLALNISDFDRILHFLTFFWSGGTIDSYQRKVLRFSVLQETKGLLHLKCKAYTFAFSCINFLVSFFGSQIKEKKQV